MTGTILKSFRKREDMVVVLINLAVSSLDLKTVMWLYLLEMHVWLALECVS